MIGYCNNINNNINCMRHGDLKKVSYSYKVNDIINFEKMYLCKSCSESVFSKIFSNETNQFEAIINLSFQDQEELFKVNRELKSNIEILADKLIDIMETNILLTARAIKDFLNVRDRTLEKILIFLKNKLIKRRFQYKLSNKSTIFYYLKSMKKQVYKELKIKNYSPYFLLEI